MTHRSYNTFGVLTDEYGVSDETGILTADETANAVDCIFGYTGKMFDEVTELQNNVNRWYNPELGKWLSEDPIGFNAGDTNVYRYVGNNTIQFSDPLGLIKSQDKRVSAIFIYINTANAPTDFVFDEVEDCVENIFRHSKVWVFICETNEEIRPNSHVYYVDFHQGGDVSHPVAQTNGECTTIWHNEKDSDLWGDKYGMKPTPEVIYANIITHEVFWHGVLDRLDSDSIFNFLDPDYYFDDCDEQTSWGSSNDISGSVLIKIPAAHIKQIEHALEYR